MPKERKKILGIIISIKIDGFSQAESQNYLLNSMLFQKFWKGLKHFSKLCSSMKSKISQQMIST
tara:strand:- start:95882 stop:96073 length:192 start_codon:yes stop_codon:yes gene_type:complete